jgi:homoserine dehydrogenase
VATEEVAVGILGYGTVGSGAYHILTDNADGIAVRAGCTIAVKKVADIDWTRLRGCPVPPSMRTTEGEEIVSDPGIDIVVETIGGTEPALELVLGALRNGKSVVTSNKEMIAKHGDRIFEEASKSGVDVGFEGAVCGTIPIVRSLKEGLEANRYQRIIGILNGTTNYILTQMTEEGMAFGDALEQAQALGFAEQDPSSDVDGLDAAYKVAILAAIAFGQRVPVEAIHREGIRDITPTDIRYAGDLGCVIKLLAIAQRSDDGRLEVRVHPTFLAARHPLASVSGEFNAVFVEGHASGEVMLYGRGAGAMPTGSAVVSDIIDCARNIRYSSTGRIPCVCSGTAQIKGAGECITSCYIRMRVADRPGVLGRAATVFGEEGVSIKSVLQVDTIDSSAEIVWLTHPGPEGKLMKALECIRACDFVEDIAPPIRVEG